MRPAASLASVISAACAVAVLAGCGTPAAPSTSPPSTSPPSTSAAATSAPASASPSAASPSATVPAGWKTFTTSDGTLAFDYPEAWTIVDPAGPPADGGVFVALVSDYGKTMATLRTGMTAGAECPEKLPFMVYDTEPVPALAQDGEAPRFVYEGRTDPAAGDPSRAMTFGYGITSEPEPFGDTACPISHFFTWPPNRAMFSGVYDPFDTTPGAPKNVDTPEVYMDTTEYKDVKQAIMSLRPAGK